LDITKEPRKTEPLNGDGYIQSRQKKTGNK
jgi:hypothetical protein